VGNCSTISLAPERKRFQNSLAVEWNKPVGLIRKEERTLPQLYAAFLIAVAFLPLKS
jgi:hypothetical protein